MTLLDLDVDGNEVRAAAQRCIDSHFKVQHATIVGQRLVVCFEHFLAVLPDWSAPTSEIDLSPGSPWRIDDTWFGGLHTVFPVDDDICIVSSSGADAVLWVNLNSRKVVQRWRLPQEIYGFNYELTPEMSVVDHYIHNDIQLGHLNCAYPDGRGGCYISTLFQGDIAHLDADGRYGLLARGHIGCHGVRIAQNGRDLYFSDSCGGRLMQVGADASVRELWAADSHWLHDAVHLEDGLYLLCLGDKNEIAVIDTDAGRELGRIGLDSRGVNVQFASIVG